MPRIENIVIEPYVDIKFNDNTTFANYDSAKVSWTGNANLLTYIFYNGVQVFNALDFGAVTAREYDIPWNPNTNQVLTIIEEAASVIIDPVDYKIEEYPTFYWWPSKNPEVKFYRIYKEELNPGKFEQFEQDFNHLDGYSYFAWNPKSPFDVEDGKWYHMRIESFDEKYQTESTSDGFNIFMHGYPEMPVNIQVTDGTTSGKFDIIITKGS